MTILDQIQTNANRNPERVMFHSAGIYSVEGICKDLLWKELEEYSGKLAFYLDKILKDSSPVIVYGHKNPFMLVCFLACVKSGRAYCPIDTSVPLNRVEAIIKEVEPEIILTTETFSLQSENILSLDTIKEIIKNEKAVINKEKYVSSEDTFYIIFTSGSTGTPKGVQITRENLDNFIKWASKLGVGLIEGSDYTFINQAPFSFDLSVMDLYLTLYYGGTLWALEKNTQNDIRLLFESLMKSDADVWVSTPSFADMCLADKIFCKDLLPNLKLFLFCGEVLTNKTAKRLLSAFPMTSIINTYGPTESTVAITDVKITAELIDKKNPLPVGKAKEGTWVFIMDESGNILSDGEKGEIVIVGDTVSAGYWNSIELTNKVFGSYEIAGEKYRLYHTGDKGYKEDEQLYYCGRIDLQIKLHGYRIEIEDIESNIIKLSGICKAAVMPTYKDGQVRSLTAYIVADDIPEKSFEAAQNLRERLKGLLPDYMIPKKIIFLESLPMTNNGKVDRKVLGGMKG